MSITLQKITNAWHQAVRQEQERVDQPPDLTIRQNGEVIARNLRVLEHLIGTKQRLNVTLPNRLTVRVYPSTEHPSKFDVRINGELREYRQEYGGGGIAAISLSVDDGQTKLSRALEFQVLGPLSREFSSAYTPRAEHVNHFTLLALTTDQAAKAIREIDAFDPPHCAPPEPSYVRIVANTVNQLIR